MSSSLICTPKQDSKCDNAKSWSNVSSYTSDILDCSEEIQHSRLLQETSKELKWKADGHSGRASEGNRLLEDDADEAMNQGASASTFDKILFTQFRPSKGLKSSSTDCESSDDEQYSDANELRALRETVTQCGWTIYERSWVSFTESEADKIGEGAQGNIYRGSLLVPNSSGRIAVAVKKLHRKKGITQGHCPPELRSVKSLMYLCVPLGVFFDHSNCLCIIMALYESDLWKVIDSEMKLHREVDKNYVGPPFQEHVAVHIIIQLVLGLKALHECKIYHRDIKCSNILVNKARGSDHLYEVGISDFETSDNAVGTGFWRAPELLQILKDDDRHSMKRWQPEQWRAVDVYSFGMSCYEIMTGTIPAFEGVGYSDYDVILIHKERPVLPDHVPEPLRGIIKDCWNQDPHSRPDFDDILFRLSKSPCVDNHGLSVWLEEVWNTCESSPCATLEEDVQELKLLLASHLQQFEPVFNKPADYANWASMFISTWELFASQFPSSLITVPVPQQFYPFTEYVERRRLCNLAFHQICGYASAIRPENLPPRPQHLKLQFCHQIRRLGVLMNSLHTALNTSVENQSQLGKEEDHPVAFDDKARVVVQFFMCFWMEGMDMGVAQGELQSIIEKMEDGSDKFMLNCLHIYTFAIYWYDYRSWLYKAIKRVSQFLLIYGLYTISGCSDILYHYFGYSISGFLSVCLAFYGFARYGFSWWLFYYLLALGNGLKGLLYWTLGYTSWCVYYLLLH